MEPFARTIDAKKKYVVSSTLERVDQHRRRLEAAARDDAGRFCDLLRMRMFYLRLLARVLGPVARNICHLRDHRTVK